MRSAGARLEERIMPQSVDKKGFSSLKTLIRLREYKTTTTGNV
jgi:hypothetical protein